MKISLFSIIFLIFISSTSSADEPIKIMPMGNSITAGEHYGQPAMGKRTGYRKILYWMLINSGYNVDFVGSRKHGELPKDNPNWYDWESESYPGSGISDITGNVKYYLPKYKPDILLVHVGTNGTDWSNKPGQVMSMLNMINNFAVAQDYPITVFLCKIINQYYKEDQAPTTQFNIAVADTVATRKGDKIKIIMVDMENGAGLDYTDNPPNLAANPPYEGGDMWGTIYPGVPYDKYHPNDKGNTKMAVKFYQELVKELGAPSGIEYHKNNAQPMQFELYQNYPNPFNPETTIKFAISKKEYVKLCVYNVYGQEIKVLVNSFLDAGTYTASFSGLNLPNGVYFYRLERNGVYVTRRMILLK